MTLPQNLRAANAVGALTLTVIVMCWLWYGLHSKNTDLASTGAAYTLVFGIIAQAGTLIILKAHQEASS